MLGPEADEPLLSDEETNALLDAMREEERTGEVEVVSTDLGSPEGPMREALGRADAAASALGKAARTQLLVMTARGIDVELLPAEIVPRDVLGSSLDPRAMLYDLRHRGTSHGILSIDSGLARYVLERSMGAAGEDPSGGPATRGFTDLDRRLLGPFPKAVSTALANSFLEGRPLSLTPHDEPEDVSGSTRFEPMLRLGLRFAVAGTRVGELLIALNATSVAASAPKPDDEANARPAVKAEIALRASVRQAEVELVAVLGRAPSSVRQLLELAKGDVFRLDGSPRDPLQMCVGDVVVARGKPLVVAGDLAVEITELRGKRAAATEAA